MNRNDPSENRVLYPEKPNSHCEGHWIWVPQSAGLKDRNNYPWRNSYVLFRKTFRAQGAVKIDIAADTRCELFVDGRRIGRSTMPSCHGFKSYDSYELRLKPGRHVVAVCVHHLGQSCATAAISRPGLWLQATSASGLVLATDASWKAIPAWGYVQHLPEMMSHFGFYQICDYSRIPDGWQKVSFDDNGWHDAETIGKVGCKPWRTLMPRPVRQLKTVVLKPAEISSAGSWADGPIDTTLNAVTVAHQMAARTRSITKQGNLRFPLAVGKANHFLVVDFGREVTGHLRMKFRQADAGRIVDVGYDEKLDKRGLPDPLRTYVFFADRIILRENQTSAEIFDARGFRYLLLDIKAGSTPLEITGIELDERAYPVDRPGTFTSDRPQLNDLYATSIETVRLCMLDTYVDCPSRERVMWMDFYISSLCSSWAMGITDMWRNALYMFAQDATPEGCVKSYCPSDNQPVFLAFSMYYIHALADYLLHTADYETARKLYPTARAQLQVIKQHGNHSGLIESKPASWHPFLDWSAMDWGGFSAGHNAIYIKTWEKFAWLTEKLGHPAQAGKIRRTLRDLRGSYRRIFWSPRKKLFADTDKIAGREATFSQLTNVLAIWAGLADQPQAVAIMKTLLDKTRLLPLKKRKYIQPGYEPQRGGIVRIGTPAMALLMAHVLYKLDLDSQAEKYIADIWDGLAENGTFREHLKEDAISSFCHGWGAGPAILLPRFVLGVEPLEPGFQKISVTPHPGTLKRASGTIPTVHGPIHVAWKKAAGGALDVRVTAPEGISIRKRSGAAVDFKLQKTPPHDSRDHS